MHVSSIGFNAAEVLAVVNNANWLAYAALASVGVLTVFSCLCALMQVLIGDSDQQELTGHR